MCETCHFRAASNNREVIMRRLGLWMAALLLLVCVPAGFAQGKKKADPTRSVQGTVSAQDESAVKGAVVVRVESGLDWRFVGHHFALAGAVVIHRRRGGHAVEPGAQVVGVAQLRIGPQRAQQRVLQDILRGAVARHPARVDEQLVAVGLYERPERWQHAHRTRHHRKT